MQSLELRGVHKSFGGLKAVNDLSLTIEPKKVFGIIGPNGAGKDYRIQFNNRIFKA